MPTMTIEPTTRGSDILSFMGVERLFVVKQGPAALLTPTTEDTEPEEYGIDHADYPDTTAYLNAIPGAVEHILAYRDLPDSEFEEWN